MATEVSRTFDLEHGAVFLTLKDELGNISAHTIYVTGPGGVKDLNAAIEQAKKERDDYAATVKAAFTSIGWTANGNPAS